jgi:hypothetical protein
MNNNQPAGLSIEILGQVGNMVLRAVRRLTNDIAEPINGKIVIGTYLGSAEIRSLVDHGIIPLERTSEAYSFRKTDRAGYCLAGYDDRGLMYGCLDVRKNLMKTRDMSLIQDRAEKPFIKVRGLFTFVHNQDMGDEWFFSQKYWDDYFDMMAENRFNSYNLVFSHQTDYLAPMFAYFVRVEDHPEVYPVDADESRIEKNREMLKLITEAACLRGIDFILGIWQVRAWTGDKTDSVPKQAGHVQGLGDHNIQDYTYKAVKQIIHDFEGIKGIQIRVNSESGISGKMQTEFFTETFFKAIHESARPILLDFREWCSERQTVLNAMAMCTNIRLSVKYWAEFMGAPYQPAKISPGYSYSDLLRQPLQYDLMWQVWSLGSPRLLLWGDPDYVRRFVRTVSLGGGNGFEINPHLAQKGFGNDPGYWRIFKHREDEYFSWEYERYWMFYLLFGRLSYNPDLPAAAWLDRIAERFGSNNASSMMNLYEKGSRIITFLVQYMLNDLNMYIWPEIDTGGLLDLYLETPTSDPCVIYSIAQYVKDYMRDDRSGKLSPDDASDYFHDLGTGILNSISRLPKNYVAAGSRESREYHSTLVDFTILAYLAIYHSRKILAARDLGFFYESGDYIMLIKCSKMLKEARTFWEKIISASEDFYYDQMVTGPLDSGDWRKKLSLVREDESRIRELLKLHRAYGVFYKGFDFGASGRAEYDDSYKYKIYDNYSVEKGFIEVTEKSSYNEASGFGFNSVEGLRSVMAAQVRLSDKHADSISRDVRMNTGSEMYRSFRNMLFADYVYGTGVCEFQADIETGEYQVTMVMADESEQPRNHGPMSIMVSDMRFENIYVKTGQLVERTTRVNAADGKIKVTFDSGTDADWFISGMIIKRIVPEIRHLPPRIMPDEGLLSATVTCPDELDEVKLYIREETGEFRPQHMINTLGPCYEADILPLIQKNKIYQYYISAGSISGRESFTGQYDIWVKENESRFDIIHVPKKSCREGMDLQIVLDIKSPYQLKTIRLCYSHVNQHAALESSLMYKESDHYGGFIPAAYIKKEWDILYYFDMVDITGKGTIYPDFRIQTPYYVVHVLSPDQAAQDAEGL